MKPGEKQFWRVANATLQDFMQPASARRWHATASPTDRTRRLSTAANKNTDTILIPPAGRAEFIVQAPPSGSSGVLYTDLYDTGPTGNADVAQPLADIQLTDGANSPARAAKPVGTPPPAGRLHGQAKIL